MDARAYLDQFGEDRCKTVAAAAGTTLGYFKQIAYRHRRPSVDLAKQLEDASVKHRGAPEEGVLDFVSLLNPPPREQAPPHGQAAA